MSLQHAKHYLELELQAARNRPVFARAQERRPELSRHDTPSSILVVLRDDSARVLREKERLARDILAEHAQRPHSLWAALLLLACYPMLRHLRRRIHGDTIPADDLEQLIMSTFLEIVAAFPLEHKRDRTFMHLRQMTQRRVFEHLRTEQLRHKHRDTARPDELHGYEQRSSAWPDMPLAPRCLDPEEQAAQIAFLSARAGHALDASKLEPIIATTIRGERITGYIARVYPHAGPTERQRIYQRIKRTHSRALSKLRLLLGPLHDDTKASHDLP